MEYLERRRDVRDNLGPWIKQAHEDLRFAAGEQWDKAGLERMKLQRRPALTFNQIAPLVDTVTGNEITNRFEPHFLPRTVNQPQQPGAGMQPAPVFPGANDQPVVDVVSQVVRYYRDKSLAGHEESQSFRQTAICGVGCVEVTYDVSKDPKGVIATRHVCIKEMAWDPTSKSQNLEDAQYVMRYRWIPRATAEHLYGEGVGQGQDKDSPEELGAAMPAGVEHGHSPWYFSGDQCFINKDRNQVLVTEYQWIEQEPVYVVRGDGQGPRIIDAAEYQNLQINMEQAAAAGQPLQLQVESSTRPCVYQAFFVGQQMVREPEKLNTGGKFTFRFMTGFRDDSGPFTYWRGIVHRIKDPQRWANVFLSSMVNQVSRNPKGNLLVPKGAFKNAEEAKNLWAAAGSMLEVENPRALGDIKHFSQPPLPPAAHDLVQLCWNVIPQLTGVSPYMSGSGIDDLRRTPSSSIQAMQQAGMTVLSPLFDGLSRYKKSVGELYLSLIRNYLDDGVVVRIVDQPTAQYVHFFKDEMAHDYDVVVHENPSSPSAKANVWKTFTDQGLLQMLMQYGPLPPSIADLIPDLPENVRNDLRNTFAQAAQMMAAQQQQPQQPQSGPAPQPAPAA